MIVADYGGEVPADMKELVKLPGVGRKTANIVLNVGYGIVEGIAVDTHVNRIAHRLMLSPKTHAKEPLKTEQDLLKILPHEYWELELESSPCATMTGNEFDERPAELASAGFWRCNAGGTACSFTV